MADRTRFDAPLLDVTPSLLGIARAYPEVVRGAVVERPRDTVVAPERAPPLVLPSWGRREVPDPVPIDLPFHLPADDANWDPVLAFARARCPLGLVEAAHLPPLVCGPDADRVERRATPAEIACLREALERTRVGTEPAWIHCQLGSVRSYEGWARAYYDELFRWLRDLGCPPLACETLRRLAESTGDVRTFTGCPDGTAESYRLRLGNAPERIEGLVSSITVVECRPRVSLPRPRPADGDFFVDRPPYADGPPRFVSGLALEGPASDGKYDYPRGCRVGGAYLAAEGVVVIASIEAFGDGRVLQLRRLDVRASSAQFGRLVDGATESVVIGAAPGPADGFGRNGLRAHQVTVAPELDQPALFAVVDSPPGSDRGVHFIVEASGDPSRAARMVPVIGTVDAYPAPAGIAYGRAGTAGEGRLAFSYVRLSGAVTTIEFGFLTRGLDRWVFRRTASVPCPSRVEDNVAVVYNPIAAEWVIAFVPGSYAPGAFAQRFDLHGAPRALAPTEVVSGLGDMVVGPHSGLTLALNRRTGRYLLSVSHNAAPFEAAADGTLQITANDGRVVGPSLHQEFDRLYARFYRGGVWTVGPSYVTGLEFRGGGPKYEDLGTPPNPGTPTVCGLCSPTGPSFYDKEGPTLWGGGRGLGFVHAYLELSGTNLVLALIAHERLPDAGGELYATFIVDGPIPPT